MVGFKTLCSIYVTYNEISNLLAKNTEEATKGLQLMLGTSEKIHELSL